METEEPAVNDLSNNEPIVNTKDEKSRKVSTLSFIFVILVLGVPMWWKTTEVYRVPLPYSGIRDLSKSPISITSRVGIFANSSERSVLLIQELNNAFEDNYLLRLTFYQINVENSVLKQVLTPAELEGHILRYNQIAPGEFLFIEWKNLNEDILVTSGRTAMFSTETSSVKIQQVLRSWIYQEHKLRKIISNLNDEHQQKQQEKQQELSTQKTKQRSSSSVVPQPQYDVLISVLNPRPDIHNIQWNVRKASEAYIQPFLEGINFISNFSLKSQWKYQVPLEFPSYQVKDNSTIGRHYALPDEYFPHIVTAVEKKLGNPISDNPCIHLVVYIPPCENGPLHIYNKRQQRLSPTNVESFISIGWGGIVIQNPDMDACSKYMNTHERIDIDIKSEDVMQVLLHILRKIIDLEVDVAIERANIVPLDTVQPRQWEIEAYARNAAVHLITSTTLTLQSLIQLLGAISNIVINDEVGHAVINAFEHLIVAKECLETNDIYNAIVNAKQAFIASEMAFFHPSILALLYFPDDQKYAIYIPLFLPIMIPVVLSLKNFRKFKKDSSCSDGKKND